MNSRFELTCSSPPILAQSQRSTVRLHRPASPRARDGGGSRHLRLLPPIPVRPLRPFLRRSSPALPLCITCLHLCARGEALSEDPTASTDDHLCALSMDVGDQDGGQDCSGRGGGPREGRARAGSGYGSARSPRCSTRCCKSEFLPPHSSIESSLMSEIVCIVGLRRRDHAGQHSVQYQAVASGITVSPRRSWSLLG